MNAIAMYAAASVPKMKKVLRSVVSMLAPRSLHIIKVVRASSPIPIITRICLKAAYLLSCS
jgi:hypothetical protein